MDTQENADIPRLGVPSTEDPMQLSPDMDRHLSADEDIDIDFDLEAEITHDDDDNNMDRQDGSDHISDIGNDDEMIDDKGMQDGYDDNASLIDEDLGDAESSVVDNTQDLMAETRQDGGTEQEMPSGEILQVVGAAETNTQGQDHYEEIREDLSDDALQVDLEQPRGDQNVQNTKNPSKGPSQAEVEALAQETDTGAHDFDDITKGHEEISLTKLAGGPTSTIEEQTLQTEEEIPRVPRDELAKSQSEVQGSGQQAEYQYLHPVIVVYQGNEMSLFPPSDQGSEQSQTYFLHDETFARDSISTLLQQCRLVLADSINEHDKLELKIPDLGFNVDESTALTTDTTLAQIVDIYLHLTHNDGQDDPDPLYTELCVNTSCLDRLEYLLTAVADGKGLSQLESPFAFEASNQDDGPSYDDEDNDGEQRAIPKESSETYGRAGAMISQPEQSGLSDETQKSPVPSLSGEEDADKITSNPTNDPVGTFLEDTEIDNLTELADQEVTQNELFVGNTEEDGGVNSRTEEPKEHTTDDIIDYPDDEDLAGDTSAGSSTLQGDVNDWKTSNISDPTQDSALPTSDTINIDMQASEHESARLDDAHYNLEGLLDQPALEDQWTIGSDKKPASDENTEGIIAPSFEDANDYSLAEEYGEANDFHDDALVGESHVETQTQMLKSHTEDQNKHTYEETQPNSNGEELKVELRSADPEFDQHRSPVPAISNDPTGLQGLGPATNDLNSSNGEADSGFGHDRFDDMPENLTTGFKDGPTSLPLQRTTTTEEAGSALDDADEITFDDDEEGTNRASKPSRSDTTPNQSPHTLKRMRSSQEDDLGANGHSSEVKRFRST